MVLVSGILVGIGIMLAGGIAWTLENKYYYTADNGWKEIDGEWYIFDSRGYALQDAWYYDKNYEAWYYLDDDCKMERCIVIV